jgi:hypothetical protein
MGDTGMENATEPSSVPAQDGHTMPAGPLIFISHDSRDGQIAESFSKLLSSVTAGMLKTFRSSDRKGSQGFEYGVEWFPELMSRLGSACDVVCLLTKRSLERPWILYEAGVAKGKLNIPVHGLALGVPLTEASTGPFAQFQNCGDDVDSLTKLTLQLIRRLPNADPDQQMVRSQVEVFLGSVQGFLKKVGAAGEIDNPRGETAASKQFEEIKLMFQELPFRLERIVAARPDARVSFGTYSDVATWIIRSVDVGSEVFRQLSKDNINILIVSSYLQNDAPWLSVLGAQAYRASLEENKELETRILSSLLSILQITRRDAFLASSEPALLLMERLLRLVFNRLSELGISQKGDASLLVSDIPDPHPRSRVTPRHQPSKRDQ